MSKIGRRINLLVIAASLFVVSCSTTEGDGLDEDNRAISFQMPQTVSRAAIDQFPAGSTFLVWGGYDNNATGIFNGETVTESKGSWNYSGGTRYWAPGKTYDFYAVYPQFPAEGAEGQTIATVAPDGTITVTGFDCSKTGAEAVDLMTASNIGISYAAEQKPSPVALKFNHELARIVIVAKNHPGAQGIEGYKPTVHDAVLYGMYKTGDLTANYQDNDNRIANWTIPSSGSGESATDKNNPLAKITNPIEVTNADGETIIEILVFPQSITAEYFLDLAFSTSKGENPTIKNFSVQLSSLPITEWVAGKQYRYSFTITPDDRILFDKPTVEKWDEAAGGIIIVD